MLQYQVFRPSPEFNCNELSVCHYLSCGSFRTPFTIKSLDEFSKYKVNSFTKFTNSVNKQKKDHVFLILKGEGKFDGKILNAGQYIINPIEISGTEKPFQFIRLTLSSSSSDILQKLCEFQVVKKKEWGISRRRLQANEQLQLNQIDKRLFVMVNSGEINLQGKTHPITEGESVLIKSRLKVKANKQTDLILVHISD